MTDAQRAIRERQVRVLAACGERGPALAALFGVSARTLKRVYRKTAATVTGGRTPGPPPGWLGRERKTTQELLQLWLNEGLEKMLAGEAPYWLQQLAVQFGLASPAQIAAMFQRVQVGTDSSAADEESPARVIIRQCPNCSAPVVALQPRGRHRSPRITCTNPGCRRPTDYRAPRAIGSHKPRDAGAMEE